MKNLWKLLALMMAILMISAPALAVAEDAARPAIVAHKANGIVIDGDLSDWNRDSPAVVDQREQVVRDLLTSGGADYWGGPIDLSAIFYLAWDEEYVYFAADVTEDTPLGATADMRPMDEMDSLMLWISTNPESDINRTNYDTWDWMIQFLMNYEETMKYGEPMDTYIDRNMVAEKQRFVSLGQELGGSNVLPHYEPEVQETTLGFTFECRFAWADLSGENELTKRCPIEKYVPKAGDVLLCNFGISDIDYPCPGTEYIPIMAWSGGNVGGTAYSYEYIKQYPALWGTVTLAD